MSSSNVILTSFTRHKQDSIETYMHEWQSIHQSQLSNSNSQETDEDLDLQEKDEGIYTNPDAILLEKLGFGKYVSQLATGDNSESTEDTHLTDAGLSKHQAHVIRRRMNTLRTTVRSRRKRDSTTDEPELRLVRNTGTPIQLGTKVFRSVTPGSSPQASPTPARRSRSSYGVNEGDSRRNKNNDHNKDSGVYSASSSRDGTPVRGGQQAGEAVPTLLIGGSSDGSVRNRGKVLMGLPSPFSKHGGSTSSLEQNGTHGSGKQGLQHMERVKSTSRINPMSLNLVARTIDHSPKLRRRKPISSPTSSPEDSEGVLDGDGHRARCSSDKPHKRSEQQASRNGGSKSLPRGGNEVRPISPLPGQDSGLSSPEDTKLVFGSPAHNGSVSHAPNGIQDLPNGIQDLPNGIQDLPNFMISPNALGTTRSQDLSQQDMEKVRSVALLELTVTFDDHDIPLRPRRQARAKSYPENALRGVPLNVLLQTDQRREPSALIPLVLDEMIGHLESYALDHEGLLRVPGSSARVASLLQDLEDSFHFGQFSFSGLNVNDVSSLLKQFIRELPVPLLTREYLPAFASIADISDLKEQVRTLNLLILLLPTVNQRVLKRLLEFLEKITQHSAASKMDLTNVAMVIAPNLFIRLPSRLTLDDVAMATKTSHIVRLLIRYHDLLWTIPGEMLRQIRYLYENEVRKLDPRSVQKAIKQMQHQLMEQQPTRGITIPEVSHHIIRVKAPLFTRVCMAVDICVGVTAGDIITKLQRKSRLNQDVIKKRFSSTSLLDSSVPHIESPVENTNKLKVPEEMVNAGEQFLFEVGGNIGERCLPNDTDMYSLYSVNPHAQWIIKPRNCPDLN